MPPLTRGLVGGLLLLAGLAMFVVPATNVWPFALISWAVGGGLTLGVLIPYVQQIGQDMAADDAKWTQPNP